MTVVTDRYRGTKEYFLVHSELVTAARYRGTVTYMEVARILGIHQPGGHMGRELGQILGEISEDEVARDRPMLSALAVSTTRVPSDGFFVLAQQLGLLQDNTPAGRTQFWDQTCRALYETWRR